MRLETIRIRNFRLLRRASIDLAAKSTTTVFVGPNNSGKTSVMDALRVFTGMLSDTVRISIHDLSQVRHRDFDRLEVLLSKAVIPEKRIALVRRFAPRMRLDLTFSYMQTPADIVVASQLLMGLDMDDDRVCLRIEYDIDNAKALLDDFEARRRKEDSLHEFLKDNFGTYFKRKYFKVSRTGAEIEQLDGGQVVERLIKFNNVPAQRHVDDDEASNAVKISRLMHEHYMRFYKIADAEGFDAIEAALEQSSGELTKKYAVTFKRLTERLKAFGYPQGQIAPDLRIRAEMNSQTLYKDNTRIYYANEYAEIDGTTAEFELPERYNGLGYKNLIYIVLQLEAFQSVLEAALEVQPRVHVIAIEEPEAHLHPQMQCIFINEVSKALDSQAGITAQVILSTHSSHMIANSGFEPVRYFRRKGREVSVRDLSKLPMPPDDPSLLDFLRRYIKLTHCDLFFADKAVFVEGQVERLLLPLMIESCTSMEGCADLASQYISISEVGGAYAHKFKPIMGFLGIPTLIITDLDSVNDSGKKCRVSEGTKTSNACLRTWIPARATLSELLACGNSEKTEAHIQVAYQTAENGNCGRSFEEAFIYANLSWLTANSDALVATGELIKTASTPSLATSAWELSGQLNKVDFALDLIARTGWATPSYIREGLSWLAKERAV
jgi:putative ATP-dependent endonuclease of OLD family